MSKLNVQKPFLKWIGGKSQILDKIIARFPTKIKNYHDIFLGGGSVLLAVLSLQKLNKIEVEGDIFAYDINENLINVYKQIQNNKDKLYDIIEKHISVYHGLSGIEINRAPKNIVEAKSSKESYYYWIRNKYNNCEKNTAESAALFMFLNKTGFRGLYREGPNGFNVPYGHYKKTPTVIKKEDLDVISDLIKDVKFIKSDFRISFSNVYAGDFVYIDPPYVPETSKSFVGYVIDGFDEEMHDALFNIVTELKEIKFVMNNSRVPRVLNFFKDYTYDVVSARRAINSLKPDSCTTEVIIYN